MLRLLKEIILAFKPLSDAEVMQMNLNGPQATKKEIETSGVLVDADGSIHVKSETVWDYFDQGPGQHGNWR